MVHFIEFSATGENGFEKNEAFAELDEEVNGQPHQKYSVKTVPSISHNGRNYYWYSGNFNPSTPTDLLITQPTTKTAKFKGTQLSSQTDAYNTTSQRKFVKTDDGWLLSVYSSMGRIWFEASSDNGVTWKIANIDEQPLDNGEGKLTSITNFLNYSGGFYTRIAVIVFQEKFGSGFKVPRLSGS